MPISFKLKTGGTNISKNKQSAIPYFNLKQEKTGIKQAKYENNLNINIKRIINIYFYKSLSLFMSSSKQ